MEVLTITSHHFWSNQASECCASQPTIWAMVWKRIPILRKLWKQTNKNNNSRKQNKGKSNSFQTWPHYQGEDWTNPRPMHIFIVEFLQSRENRTLHLLQSLCFYSWQPQKGQRYLTDGRIWFPNFLFWIAFVCKLWSCYFREGVLWRCKDLIASQNWGRCLHVWVEWTLKSSGGEPGVGEFDKAQNLNRNCLIMVSLLKWPSTNRDDHFEVKVWQ